MTTLTTAIQYFKPTHLGTEDLPWHPFTPYSPDVQLKLLHLDFVCRPLRAVRTGRYRPEGARCADSSTALCLLARTPASTRGCSPGCMRRRCPAGLHRPGLARSLVPRGSGHAATASTRTPPCGSPRWVSMSCSAGGAARGSPTCCRHSVRASPASLTRPGTSWWSLIRTDECCGGRAAWTSAGKPIASGSWRARPGTRTAWAPTPSAPRWSHAAACRSSRQSQLQTAHWAELERLRSLAAPLLARMADPALAVDRHGWVAAATGIAPVDRIVLPQRIAQPHLRLPAYGVCSFEPLPGGWLIRLDRARGANTESEDLAQDLFGDPQRTVTVRAGMSRLRRQLGPTLDHRPYRFADNIDVRLDPPGHRQPAGMVRRAGHPGAVREPGGLRHWPGEVASWAARAWAYPGRPGRRGAAVQRWPSVPSGRSTRGYDRC